jgi:hypothetical protein
MQFNMQPTLLCTACNMLVKVWSTPLTMLGML